jgi:hypothetical protein
MRAPHGAPGQTVVRCSAGHAYAVLVRPSAVLRDVLRMKGEESTWTLMRTLNAAEARRQLAGASQAMNDDMSQDAKRIARESDERAAQRGGVYFDRQGSSIKLLDVGVRSRKTMSIASPDIRYAATTKSVRFGTGTMRGD